MVAEKPILTNRLRRSELNLLLGRAIEVNRGPFGVHTIECIAVRDIVYPLKLLLGGGRCRKAPVHKTTVFIPRHTCQGSQT